MKRPRIAKVLGVSLSALFSFSPPKNGTGRKSSPDTKPLIPLPNPVRPEQKEK
jgi:hypothetical protein